MKKNKIAASLIEALVVIVILAMWIVATYSFFARSIAFLDWLNMRIEAIEIAREGIEAVENIRNTNWLLFPVKTENCWNVLGYKSECILDTPPTEKIPWPSSSSPKTYILKNDNWRWWLETPNLFSSTNFIYTNHDFREKFAVWKDNLWKYCQPVSAWVCDKLPKWNYTRKIQVYRDWNDKMIVKSIVEWIDSSTSWVRKVEIYNLLTNYKE